MGNQHQRAFKQFQAPLKPFHSRNIQIVGWFVKQQNIGFSQQGPRHAGAHLPSAAEVAHRTLQILLPEAESRKRRGRTMTNLISAKMLKCRLKMPKFIENIVLRTLRRSIRKQSLQLAHPLLNARQFARCRGCIRNQRLLRTEKIKLLMEKSDASFLRNRDLSPVCGKFIADHGEKRTFPGSIGPDNPGPFPLFHTE